MRYVDDDGTPTEDAPDWLNALVQLEAAQRRLAGADLRIAQLEADRERAAMEDPLRPEVELLHKLWKRATGRRRGLDANDREQISRALQGASLLTCLKAIAGAAYDPHKRQLRNGKTESYNDLELIFRNAGKVADFARRAPKGWTPDPERIAEIGGVPVEYVQGLLKGKGTNG